MTWHEMLSCDMVWCDLARHGMACHAMVCHVVGCGVVWYGMGCGVWCGVVWCDVVSCGVVWRGVVWCSAHFAFSGKAALLFDRGKRFGVARAREGRAAGVRQMWCFGDANREPTKQMCQTVRLQSGDVSGGQGLGVELEWE